MPTSDRQGKFITKAIVDAWDPQEVWDIGPGEGAYHTLLEDDHLNPWPNGNRRYWIGVEVWEPYIEKYGLRERYDHIINKNVMDIEFESPNRGYLINMAIFGDVLEHLPEDDARHIILKAKEYFRYIVVSIPIVHAPQGEVDGNPYEAHLKHWTFEEMHNIMGKCMAFQGHTIGLYFWDSEEDV